jgi:hypothetical protein
MPNRVKPIDMVARELDVDLAVIEAICSDDENFLVGYVIDVLRKDCSEFRTVDEDAIEELRVIVTEAKKTSGGLDALVAKATTRTDQA